MPKTCLKEGCNYNRFGGGYCKFHQYLRTDKPVKKLLTRTPIKKKDRSAEIQEDNAYYSRAIQINIKNNNGVCLCQECNHEIKQPVGRNVAHLIGKGANKALYHDIRNHVILGKGEMFGECNCLWKFDESGEWESMKIAKRVIEIKVVLLREYYIGR